MSKKYVQKCDRTNVQYSEIIVPPINVMYADDVAVAVLTALQLNSMQGRFALVVIEDFIVAFYYEYKNKRELKMNEGLCENLHDIACAFYEAQQALLDAEIVSEAA
jgi:hypothetical protein